MADSGWRIAQKRSFIARLLGTSEPYQLTQKYQIASLPLQQRGPLLRIHAPAAFGRPVHQKDRKGALSKQSLQSTSCERSCERLALRPVSLYL
jgi:hypothetical protein